MPSTPPPSVATGAQKTCVLLCHFGGPEGPTAVEPFLQRLFEDPAILRFPMGSWLRRRLARSISAKRAPRVLEEYRKIGFSPINQATLAQARHLEARMQTKEAGARVLVINRYTPPFAEDVLASLQLDDATRYFLISLYPHFSTTSTGSSFDQIDRLSKRLLGQKPFPATRVHAWWDDPSYKAYSFSFLRASLAQWAAGPFAAEPLSVLFSAHGIPQRFIDAGDPYADHIKGHVAALTAESRRWLEQQAGGQELAKRCHFDLAFQSRVGPVQWVRPYTDEVIPQFGRERGGYLLIVPISFVSDHLETLYEMDVTYKNLALEAGFKHFARVSLPNSDPGLASCLYEVLQQYGF